MPYAYASASASTSYTSSSTSTFSYSSSTSSNNNNSRTQSQSHRYATHSQTDPVNGTTTQRIAQSNDEPVVSQTVYIPAGGQGRARVVGFGGEGGGEGGGGGGQRQMEGGGLREGESRRIEDVSDGVEGEGVGEGRGL